MTRATAFMVVALVAMFLMSTTATATAQDDAVSFDTVENQQGAQSTIGALRDLEGNGGVGRSDASVAAPTSTRSSSTPDVPRFMMEVFRGAAGDGDACVDTIYPTVDSFQGASMSGFWAIDAQIQDHTEITGAPPPPCDPDDPDNPPPAGPTGPELLLAAERFIDTLVPPPGLTTEPPRNEGFVGVPVLVQLGHDHVIDVPPRTVTLFGAAYSLRARLTASTTVDWGDGETEDGVSRPGATYDQVGGDLDDQRLIRHVYIDRGPVTITATDTWTVELTLEGVGSNTVGGITLAESADIDIIEMQSVITND